MPYLLRFVRFLNPFSHLGDRNYNLWFSPIVVLFAALLTEVVVKVLFANDPSALGGLAILIFVSLIVYFAFREGIVGGVSAVGITILYYLYIIYSRHYAGEQLSNGIETTIVLGVVYLVIALVIGGLKEQIDLLIHKEAEARIRIEAIIEQLPVGIMIADMAGKVISANQRLAEILGVPIPVGLQIGTDMVVKASQNGREVTPAQAAIKTVLETGKPVIGREFTVHRIDGRDVFVKVNSAPIRNKTGKVVAAASIVYDVTREKEIEVRKDDFVSMASHELKTPITSLKLYLDSLEVRLKKIENSSVEDVVSKIKLQITRIQTLINALLDVSRLQTGKLVFKRERFRLDKLISQLVEDMQQNAGDIHLEFAAKPAVTVVADQFRIYQVLTNLLTNAIKYSGEGKRIILKLKKESDRAVVSVQDFGIGIDAQQQKLIFQRLYQVTTTKEKTFPGFGMGLYISQEIVKRHRGKIWVESELGKGSTFYFSLPLGGRVG